MLYGNTVDFESEQLDQLQLRKIMVLALASLASVLVALVMLLGSLQNVSSLTTPMGLALLTVIALLTAFSRREQARRRTQILASQHLKRAIERSLGRPAA